MLKKLNVIDKWSRNGEILKQIRYEFSNFYHMFGAKYRFFQ